MFDDFSNGLCLYQTLRNVSNIEKFQCLTETLNSSLSKKDLCNLSCLNNVIVSIKHCDLFH